MATDIRTITGPYPIGTQPSHGAGPADEAKQGSWHGMTLQLAPAGSAAAAAQSSNLYGAALPTIQMLSIDRRRVMSEARFRAMPTAELLQRARTLGVSLQQMRSTARSILNRGTGAAPSSRSGRSSSASRYVALQLAAASLEDEVSAEEATGMLTYAGEGQKGSSAEELLELLRDALAQGDQSEEFQHFLDDILSGLDITADDVKDYAEEIRHARNDDEKLLRLLREVQKLPELHREQDRQLRLQLRQKIRNEIREFESSSEGRQVLASFNAAPVAAGTADPANFLDTYTELVSMQRSFAAALKVLLARYPLDSLDGVLDKLKKALGDDLTAATPSHDTRWLGAVLTDLGNMALSTSLVESVRELVGLMERIERKRDEKERRRSRGEHKDDEDEDDARDGRIAGRVRR